ncbi:succinylglutamate desuccinylase/aspartoacylase family protein [Parvicella tangerina]|uniref:N-alpha-acetyl-L-2,4-diaminobutyric acid deacetylase n=1 Tax=Parvicella tangerina TaxID=2829795 RepID=A0A916JMX8_9FLAO|nr:succinylglutamate desuccinylase/aspartoacylase family protein [Parvicella tangerina]CAG5082880.1 N-alpha-acetyl-L-2,4-diaminobutyric acid deacetylase [Parvicella tangerina]
MENTFQNVPVIKKLKLDDIEHNSIAYRWLHIVSNGIGQPIYIPIIIAKGLKDGPTLGITAVVHGNELNGMSVIQRFFNGMELNKLSGTVVGVPVVNVPSLMNNERHFIDGQDLNRIMPGKKNGNRSEIYAHRVMERIVKHFDFLLDLHTASFGRVNSYYIRADLSSKMAYDLAYMQNPSIILNAPPTDGTLRGAASSLGIDAITVEVGDPNRFQKGMIRSSLTGVYNTLVFLKMYEDVIEHDNEEPVVCNNSYWIYTDLGGILQVHVSLSEQVYKDQKIATLRNVFGQILKEYHCPADGIVIGKSVNPISQTGSRIIHLGII